MLRAHVTTALDVLGLLLVAAGLAALLLPVIGWAALGVAGVVVLAGSWATERQQHRRRGQGGEFQ